MARFEIIAFTEPPETVNIQFRRVQMEDDAEYIDSVIADPSMNRERDTQHVCAPPLVFSREEAPRKWREMLRLCFLHLREHAGMTNQDSFIFRNWYGSE